jgi:hypothetical protein
MIKQAEALNRAQTGESLANFNAILKGFADRGLPMDEIKPRENVFTFDAWKALGRVVKRGEKGIQIVTIIEKTDANGAKSRRPWRTTVFHISQTEAIN